MVLLLLSKQIVVAIKKQKLKQFDFLSCSFYFLKDIVLIIITLYNPPQNSKYRVSDTDLRSSISILLFKLESLFDSSTQKKLIIMNGDVNFSHADWDTLSCSNEYEKAFITEIDALNLCSILNSSCCPDIFLCNNLKQCNLVVEANSFSDHIVLSRNFCQTHKKRKGSPPKTQHQQGRLALIHLSF